MKLFSSKKFTLFEWVLLYVGMFIPFLNIALIIWMIYKLGFLQTLYKLLIVLGLYTLSFLIGVLIGAIFFDFFILLPRLISFTV